MYTRVYKRSLVKNEKTGILTPLFQVVPWGKGTKVSCSGADPDPWFLHVEGESLDGIRYRKVDVLKLAVVWTVAHNRV